MGTCGHDVEAVGGDVWGHAGMMWRQREVMYGDIMAWLCIVYDI